MAVAAEGREGGEEVGATTQDEVWEDLSVEAYVDYCKKALLLVDPASIQKLAAHISQVGRAVVTAAAATAAAVARTAIVCTSS